MSENSYPIDITETVNNYITPIDCKLCKSGNITLYLTNCFLL